MFPRVPVVHATRAGELPLELIRMKAKGCNVYLSGNEPGFTLPSNIGELGNDITELDLYDCSLRGAVFMYDQANTNEANYGMFPRVPCGAQAPFRRRSEISLNSRSSGSTGTT